MAYRDEVLADSPVLYYELNETSGTTAAESASSSPGTYSGTDGEGIDLGFPPIVTGSTAAVRFNINSTTNDGHMLRDPVPAGWPSTAFTVEFWLENVFDTVGTVISYASSGDVDDIRVVTGSADFDLTVVGTTPRSMSPGPGSYISARRHIAITWDSASGDAELFLNGVSQGVETAVATGLSITAGGAFCIANNQSAVGVVGSDQARLTIDQVAVYPTVLSDARILAHYTEGKGTPAEAVPVVTVPSTPDDLVPPVITFVTAAGVVAAGDSITVTVDEDTASYDTTVIADYGTRQEVVFRDGSFSATYSGSRLVVNGVETIVLSKTGGWDSGGFTIIVEANDADSQVVDSAAYTVTGRVYPPYMKPYTTS